MLQWWLAWQAWGACVRWLPPHCLSPITSSMIIFCRSFSEGSVFQINYFKKGAEMFSKSMDNFLSSVVDMVQR